MGKFGIILIFLFFVFFPLFLVESQIPIAPIKIPNDCGEKSFCTCNFSDSKFYCLLNEDLIQKESYYDSHLSLIEITTSSLVLDCQGHKIEGKNKEISGIKIPWLEKIKIKKLYSFQVFSSNKYFPLQRNRNLSNSVF